jgi:hypothetical protein
MIEALRAHSSRRITGSFRLSGSQRLRLRKRQSEPQLGTYWVN